MPAPQRGTVLRQSTPGLQVVPSADHLPSSSWKEFSNRASSPAAEETGLVRAETGPYHRANVPCDRATDSAHTTPLFYSNLCCPLLLTSMQQAGVPPVALTDVPLADCGAKGASTPNRNETRPSQQRRIIRSVCEATASTPTSNSLRTAGSTRAVLRSAGCSRARRGSATTSTRARNVEMEESDMTTRVVKSPIPATSAAIAVADALSSNEEQEISRSVKSEPIVCRPSRSLSEAPASLDRADNVADSTTAGAVSIFKGTADANAGFNCWSSVASADCHSTNLRPALEDSRLSALSPRTREVCTTATEPAYVSTTLGLLDSSKTRIAADASENQTTVAPLSDDTTSTIKRARGGGTEATPAFISASPVNGSSTMPKCRGADNNCTPVQALFVPMRAFVPTSKLARSSDTTHNAARLLAPDAPQSGPDSVSALLRYADSAAVRTSPSLAESSLPVSHASKLQVKSPLLSLTTSLPSHLAALPAVCMEVAADQESTCSCHLEDRVYEAPALVAEELSRLSSRSSRMVGDTRCVQPVASTNESSKVLSIETVPAGGDAQPGTKRTRTAQNESLTCTNVLESHFSRVSSRKAFLCRSESLDKQEQPLYRIPPAMAETPSTVTSSNYSGSTSASCSPGTSSPLVEAISFYLGDFVPTSDPSSVAQQCGCETRCAGSRSVCEDVSCHPVNGASSTSIIAPSSAQLSEFHPISFPPAIVSSCHGAQQPRSAFARHAARMSVSTEDVQTTDEQVEESRGERTSSKSEKSVVLPDPLQHPSSLGKNARAQPSGRAPETALPRPVASATTTCEGGPLCNAAFTKRHSESSTGGQEHAAVRLEASIPVDRMMSVSPSEAGDDRQMLLPPPTEARVISNVGRLIPPLTDRSTAAGQRSIRESFLTVKSTGETRGLPNNNGGALNTSTLKIRCLLAASLRSIFKMLIKRVRGQQNPHWTERAEKASFREMGEKTSDDESVGSKRQRVDENQGETSIPARDLLCRDPCPYGTEKDRGLRRLTHTSLQETATSAEQHLLAAYRECFLLLTAAERKEELYIFEIVLLGGSCWYQGPSHLSDGNGAGGTNDCRRVVDGRSQQPPTQLYEHVEDEWRRANRTLYADTAREPPSKAALLQRCSSSSLDPSAAHAPNGKQRTTSEGAPDADVKTSERRKRVALRPEKWDAKKIHYVLAALDGLRDAWRQGSRTTRAKAQIIESMFTPLPQGLQPRIPHLVQRAQLKGPPLGPHQQKLVRLSPLQKGFALQQVLIPTLYSAAAGPGSKSAVNTLSPNLSPQGAGSSELPGAKRSLPSPAPLTRASSSVGGTGGMGACAPDIRAYCRHSLCNIACGDPLAGAWSCGCRDCHPSSARCDRVSCSRLHVPSYALCPNHGRGGATCRTDQGGGGGCDGVQKSCCRLRLATRPETLLLTSRLESKRHEIAHMQREHYQLQEPALFSNPDSIAAISSSRMPQVATTLSFNCTSSGVLQRNPAEREETTCGGYSGEAQSLPANALDRAGGDGRTNEMKLRASRRGKLRAGPPGSSAADDNRDVYKKPRPWVVSRRVLSRGKHKQQHGPSTSHMTATSESDSEVMSIRAAPNEGAQTAAMLTTRHSLDTNSARYSRTADATRSPWGVEEGEPSESHERKGGPNAAAQNGLGDNLSEERHNFGCSRSDGKKHNRDSPATASRSIQRMQLVSEIPSDIRFSHAGGPGAEGPTESTDTLTETPESPSGAVLIAERGTSLTEANRTFGWPSSAAEEAWRTQGHCTEGCNTSVTNPASKCDKSRVLPSAARAPPDPKCLHSLVEPRHGHSLGLEAQASTNLGRGATSSSLPRSEEESSGKATEGASRSKEFAGNTPTMNSQQQTAAIRTTRHNKTKQPGVFQFTRGPKRFWAASWYTDGHPGWKAFSVEKWGNREAFERARRAYEEKVPRKAIEADTVVGSAEHPVSCVPTPYRTASPDPDSPLADNTFSCGASNACGPTRWELAHGDKRRMSAVPETRNFSDTMSIAEGVKRARTLADFSPKHPVETAAARLLTGDVLSTEQEPRDIVDILGLVGDSTCHVATKRDGEHTVLLRRQFQTMRLGVEGDGELSSARVAPIASSEPASLSTDSDEAQQLQSLPSPLLPPECAALSQPEGDLRQTAQQAMKRTANSAGTCPNEGSALYERDADINLSYERKTEGQRSSADDDSLECEQRITLRELWNRCRSEASTSSLGAAFHRKDQSPMMYDSSSSTGFELRAPNFSGSPPSLSQSQSSPGRRDRGRIYREIEQLKLSSNEAQDCRFTSKGQYRRDMAPDVFARTQPNSQDDTHPPPETGLTAGAYALLSPTEIFPLTPENEDITAQLLLVSPEDEVSRSGDGLNRIVLFTSEPTHACGHAQ